MHGYNQKLICESSQMVEYRTGIAEVRLPIPFRSRSKAVFRPSFPYCSSNVN